MRVRDWVCTRLGSSQIERLPLSLLTQVTITPNVSLCPLRFCNSGTCTFLSMESCRFPQFKQNKVTRRWGRQRCPLLPLLRGSLKLWAQYESPYYTPTPPCVPWEHWGPERGSYFVKVTKQVSGRIWQTCEEVPAAKDSSEATSIKRFANSITVYHLQCE